MSMDMRIRGQGINIKENMLDRLIRYVAPVRAYDRFRARAQFAIANAYIGARKDRRQTQEWRTSSGDADSDTLNDIPTLRERSRDLVRNNPIATGAVGTNVTNVIGTGLQFQSRIDRDVVDMSDDEADAWESNVERRFRLWAESQDCDAARTLNFNELQKLAYRQAMENGDVFCALKRFPINGVNDLRLNLIEADRICNKDNGRDTATLAGGIERDTRGAPKNYHILKAHPGGIAGFKREWIEVPAFGSITGLRNVIHLYHMLRPGQSRGIPYLAPVIEPLKQLSQYTEAELAATVVTSMITLFITRPLPGDPNVNPYQTVSGENTQTPSDQKIKLGSASVWELAEGEKPELVNPQRPNTAFDPFFLAIVRQIGIALQIPYEILIKHYTASYTAAQAAMLEAWKFFSCNRKWFADNFCQTIFEIWLWHEVAEGNINAPGFFSGPIYRKAFCGSEWIGPSRGMIREDVEMEAVEKRLDLTLTTHSREAARLGNDWDKTLQQASKERKKLRDAGLLPDDGKSPATGKTVVGKEDDEAIESAMGGNN